MPIYEYCCDKCKLEVTEIQKIGSDAPTCQKCGGVMQRMFSPIAILRTRNEGGRIIRSKGYKEGYAKDYAKDVPLLKAPWD